MKLDLGVDERFCRLRRVETLMIWCLRKALHRLRILEGGRVH